MSGEGKQLTNSLLGPHPGGELICSDHGLVSSLAERHEFLVITEFPANLIAGLSPLPFSSSSLLPFSLCLHCPLGSLVCLHFQEDNPSVVVRTFIVLRRKLYRAKSVGGSRILADCSGMLTVAEETLEWAFCRDQSCLSFNKEVFALKFS